MLLFCNKKKIDPVWEYMVDTVHAAVRDPRLYTQCHVPDTRQGRLDMVLLHVAIISAGMKDKDIVQYVFDQMFARVEQSLRQIGVGDLSIPRKMRDILKVSNGLSHKLARIMSVDEALREQELDAFLQKNIFGTLDNMPDIAPLRDYVVNVIASLNGFELNESTILDFRRCYVTTND